MRPPRLLILLSLSILATSVLAQGQASAAAPPTTSAPAAAATSESKPAEPKPAETKPAESKTTAQPAANTAAASNVVGNGFTTLGANAEKSSSSTSSASPAAATLGAGTGIKFDTIMDTNKEQTGGIAPLLQVPPTANQPFMQASTLPEGTVFIAVGGGLGLCFLILFLWRALVAWSVNRSVKKAGFAPMQKHNHLEKEMKSLNSYGKKSGHNGGGGGPGSFYTAAAPSTLSLSDHFGGAGAAVASRSQSGLFFSPSAAAGHVASPGTPTPSGISSPRFGDGSAGDNRRSGYYPAGYYNAPGNRASMQSFTRQPRAQGSGTFHPAQQQDGGVSPPESPMVRPEAGGSRGTERAVGRYGDIGAASQSSLSLNLPPTGRAPSAVLEDLFESHKTGGRSPLSEGRGY